MHARLASWLAPWVCAVPALAWSACPPAGMSIAELDALKQAGFRIPGDAEREMLALALTDCLADPDPHLRDELAFEALSVWLRAGSLSADAVQALRRDLLRRLNGPDGAGYARPFAALALSEVARVDRLRPLFTPDERAELVSAATEYLRGVTDRRGYDPRGGWRHGVAHGADLVLQLGLNPATTDEQMRALLDAVAAQIAPQGEHFYVYGEPERLARPVYYIAARGHGDAELWKRWLEAVAAPVPDADWPAALRSTAGLARRHNAQSFVQVLYVMVREGNDTALQERLLPGLASALRILP